MDRIINIESIVREEVAAYKAESPNAVLYFMSDEEQHAYATILIPHSSERRAKVVVMARIEGDKVIIGADNPDKSLEEALLERGVRSEQIVLSQIVS
jgi:hypothetical protein